MNDQGLEKVISIFLTVILASLMIAGATYAFKTYMDDREINTLTQYYSQEQVIGDSTDDGGCLTAAGYSWCETKNKCLRIWEEPCIDEHTRVAFEKYLKESISDLSPEPEVLGGKFYITSFRYPSGNEALIDYEDGHIALSAKVSFAVNQGVVEIRDFELMGQE